MTADVAALLAGLEDYLWAGATGEAAWDVGANSGQNLERMLGAFSRVVAVEPAMESYAALAAGWGDRAGVTCLNVAVAAHDGTLVLAERAGPMSSGQLTPLDTTGFCADWGPADTTRPVVCTTLDSLAARFGDPDFVKIDTEGSEVLVLRGAGPQVVLKVGEQRGDVAHAASSLNVPSARSSM